MKFAAELSAQLPTLSRRGNRGVKQNLTILENWIRAALLKLAETATLPRRQGAARRTKITAAPPAQRGGRQRAGFQSILPDRFERLRAAENRFDISQFSGGQTPFVRKDPRLAYHRRLAAIDAVLRAPEKYVRRVKRKLAERKNRGLVKTVALPKRPVLPDLLSVSRYSDLGRYVWYFDTS